MTPMQRRAALSLRGLKTGKFGPKKLIQWFALRGESDRWESIAFSRRQLARLARIARKYRRQIADDHVLFWSQRVLAEQQFSSIDEEACPQH